jgi:IS4 transposase
MQLDVFVGKECRMPVRMILYPVDEQTYQNRICNREKEAKKRGEKVNDETRMRYQLNIFITNTSEEILPADKIYLMYKLRWQIELMFKSWKSIFCLHQTWNMKEDRYLCLLYVRLLLIVINTQIIRHIQRETNIRNVKGKVQLLSFYKAMHTLSMLFEPLYAALCSGKKAACKFFLHLRKKLSENHRLESRKTKQDSMK